MITTRQVSIVIFLLAISQNTNSHPSDYPQEEYTLEQIYQLLEDNKQQAAKIVKIVIDYCRRFEPLPDDSPYESNYPTYITLSQKKEMKQMEPPQSFASQDDCIVFMLGYVDWSKCNYDGLVYNKDNHDASVNTDYLSCDRSTCSPSSGNMKCYNSVPILCHDHSGMNRLSYWVKTPYTDHGWSEGSVVITTSAYMGCLLTSRALVDLICEYEFGYGWKWATSNMGLAIENMHGYEYTGSQWSSYSDPKQTTEFKVWSFGCINNAKYNDFWTYHSYGHNCY